ncbi:MAG: hypothetical protein WCS54_01890 [Fibrobacteraceae bacterium]
MKADPVDLFVEESGSEVYIRLRGILGVSQLEALREKLYMLIEGPGKLWFVDIEKVQFTDPAYLTLFLDCLNRVRKREGALVLIFANAGNRRFFAPYAQIFEIYPSRDAYRRSGILKRIEHVGVTYRKRTGLRLSPGIAAVLAVLLIGWVLTLLSIIRQQDAEIRTRQARVLELETQKKQFVQEIDDLRAMVGPLRHLGLVDSSSAKTYGKAGEWVHYMEMLESYRRGKE